MIKATNTKIFLLLLIVYTVFCILFERFLDTNLEIRRLLDMNDILVSLAILAAFFHEFHRAQDKKKFMKSGWIYLVASIPAVNIFTPLAPTLRLLRLLLVVRIFKKNKEDMHKRLSPTKILLMAFCVLLLICCTLILYFENVPEGNIKTALDAVYWSVVTVATVGYGDMYPVTDAGKIISIIMICCGAGIFVSLAGTFASFLTARKFEHKDKDKE